MGVIDGERRLMMRPLYPAYLFADLGESERRELGDSVRQREGEARRPRLELSRAEATQLKLFLGPKGGVDAVDGDLNTLVRVRAPREVIDALRQRCEDLSAGRVRAYVVVNEGHAA
jgi:hypothetical protein